MIIFYVALGILVGCLSTYFAVKPKLQKIQDESKVIQLKISELQLNKSSLTEEISQLENEKKSLSSKRDELLESIDKTKEMADKTNEVIYQQSYDLMQSKLEKAIKTEQEKYQMAKNDAEEEYKVALADLAELIKNTWDDYGKQIDELSSTLAAYKAKADAAIEASRREEEKELELDKYRINLTEQDLIEVNKLRDIASYFRNSRVVYKLIWESYFRAPMNELIARVVGSGTHIGIYKITDLVNGKSYIGQSVNISERFKQHCKALLQLDASNNSLYRAGARDGAEHFTFEVIEECDKSELNERERFYIDFYQTCTFGFNETIGGAKKQ